VEANSLLPGGCGVVVGVSGGADSMALLHVLRELSALRQPRASRWRITVAHLDHGIRDDSADDAKFVAATARKLGLRCLTQRRNVPAEAAAAGEGIEQAARRIRYQFLLDAAVRAGASRVAVAHHADDNVETVLHRIIRGSHIRGIAGIRPSRPLAKGVVLVRPLLPCRRAEVEAYCRWQGIAWRTDSTNADPAYSRNYIRLKLLPAVRRRLNERVDQSLLRLAQAAGEIDDYLAAQAQAVLAAATLSAGRQLVLSTAVLAAEPAVLRAYAMRLALEQLGAPQRMLTADHMAAMRTMAASSQPAGISLPGGFAATTDGHEVVVGPCAPAPQPAAAPQSVVLAVPGSTLLPDGRRISITCGRLNRPALQRHRRQPAPGVEYLDADAISGELLACQPKPGERFVPLGAAGRQKISDLAINAKVPRHKRMALIAIRDQEGIVYLLPLRLADRLKITSATRQVLRIRVRPVWP
jgi:tRNA(Ile)-lysidine synthase